MMYQDGVNLTNCDKEKVHLISRTQGHGGFVSFNGRDFKIRNISENLSKILGVDSPSSSLIGRPLHEIIGSEGLEVVKGLIRGAPDRDLIAQEFILDHRNECLDSYLFSMQDDFFGLEMIPFEGESFAERFKILNDELERIKTSKDLETLSTMASRAVRRLTGFDRVMLYRFFPPSMYGEVIGEDRVAQAHSFLYHRFPASDIPKPARDLYLKNKIRFIYDSAEENFEILPKSKNHAGLLDMSESRLRGASHMHLEYLKNMNVRTSFSVAIIVEEKLWGIIACHHPEPLYVSHRIRSLCLSVAHVFSQVAPLLETHEIDKLELGFYRELHSLYGELRKTKDPLDYLFRHSSTILNLFSATGIAYVSDDKIDVAGTTPRLADLKEFAAWIEKDMEATHSHVFEADHLGEFSEKLQDSGVDVSGVLAVRTSETKSGLLIILRPELTRTIKWGGDPKKTLDARGYQGDLNPRQSFETWTEVVRSHSLPWRSHHVEGIENFKDLLFETLINKERLIQELSERSKGN